MVHTFVQIIFMFAVVPVIIIIAIFSDRKKKRRIFDEIEKSLPGEGKLSLFQSCFKGEYGGILFEMSIESTRSGNIVRIKIVKESEFQLSLYKKAFGTIMLHKIDLEDEPGYENILASASGIDEESARMFLRNQRKADKIKWLFENDAKYIKVKKNMITTMFLFGNIARLGNPALMADAIKMMCELGK